MDPTQNQSGTPGPIFSAGPGPEEPPMASAPSGSGSKNPFSGNDIILQPSNDYYSGSKPARSKKPIIIVGAVVVVAIIALLFLLPTFNKKNVDSKNLNGSFYSYANYLLYGEEKEDELSTEYDPYGAYFIDDMIISGNDAERENYFKKLKQLYTDFTQQAGATDAYENTTLPSTVELYSNIFNFIIAYSQFSPKTIDDFLAMNTTVSIEKIKEDAKNSYAYSDVDKSSLTDQYIGNLQNIYNLEIDIIDIANKNDCINDGAINYSCVGQTETINEKMEQLNSFMITNDQLLLNAQKAISSYCWNLEEIIKYGAEEENENVD